ncbi:MAG: hypothetical protein J2P48_15840, partial [Alphaproteobacteria bacterium]|nr:hypothetical protein [Alphaproteobacteria bacterium]
IKELRGGKFPSELVFRQARPVPGLVLVRVDPSRRLRKGPRLAAINQGRPRRRRAFVSLLSVWCP